VDLDGLDLWHVGQRVLEARLVGTSLDAAIEAEIARGGLPPGRLADAAIDRVRPLVAEIVAQAGTAATESVDVRLLLGDGRPLTGTVAGVAGNVLRAVNFSRVNARQRIGAWVRLLALTAAHPGRPFEAVVVGRAPDGSGVAVVRLLPLEAGWARRELTILADLYDRGMREPLPIGCKSSAAYAEAVRDGRDAVAAGRGAWESTWNFSQEDATPEHELALDGVLSFDELLTRAPAAGEAGEGWEAGEVTRFGRLSRRLWDRLLAHEAEGRQ
jgi:exodeoxyribonuclease V gamma subunit